MSAARAAVAKAKKVVVKIGSALVSGPTDGGFQKFSNEILAIREKGCHVTLVSSGAIALGVNALGFKTRPPGLATAQGLAAIGQPALMHKWEIVFAPVPVAQFLLSRYDVTNPTSFINARRALRALQQHNVVPIGNENDTVSTEEIKIGDNDNLAAHVARISAADLLIILTGVDGLYTSNPDTDKNAKLIPLVKGSEMNMAENAAGDSIDGVGTGGFTTKLQACRIAWDHNINVVIANGKTRNILPRIMEGEEVGTLFEAPPTKRPNEWLEHKWPISGQVVITDAAADRMIKMGDINMDDVTEGFGDFHRGSIVTIRTKDRILGRGIIGYDATIIKKVKGQNKDQLLQSLGKKLFDGAVFHPEDYVCYGINP